MRRTSDSLKETISACSYSSNAGLSDDEKLDALIIDWVRIRHKVLFQGGSLMSLLRKYQINLTNESVIVDGAVVLSDELRTKFKLIISDQMFGGKILSDKKYGDIAGLLQQGGIVFRLNKHIEIKLLEKGVRFEKKENKVTYYEITPTAQGVKVLTHFKYNGNIVEIKNPEDIIVPQKYFDKTDLISSQCEHLISYDESGELLVTVTNAFISSPLNNLEMLICMPMEKQKIDDSASASASASVAFDLRLG